MPTQYSERPEANPYTVLIVEDDPLVRTFHAALISASGYSVRVVENGCAALDALREGPLPRLILLDLEMPEMGGRAFRRLQLADERLAEILVVVCTGFDAPDDDPLFAGCRFLKKPATVAGIRQLLKTLLAASSIVFTSIG